MNKWILLLSPALLISASVDAWGGRSYGQTANATNSNSTMDTNFPFNADQGWFVEESYLLMRPSLGDLEIGDMTTQKGVLHDADYHINVKTFDFDWNSGVRLGLGRYLPNHDKWDVSFYTTYFYGDSEEHEHGNLDQGKGLATSYNPFATILSEKTKAEWRMNYFVLDLMLGRQFAMTPQIIFHPYIGLRGALIYTDFQSRNFGDLIIRSGSVLTPTAGRLKVKMEEDFWGIGARAGTNFNYKFTGNWSFLGNFAGALLYGHYHVREKSKSIRTVNGVQTLSSSKSRDNDDAIRVNLDGAIGIGWEKWMKNNTVRIAPNLQFESTLWFDMNDFFKPTTTFSQDHGTLGLMGFSFNLQVDF
jgi:hypothetical protein